MSYGYSVQCSRCLSASVDVKATFTDDPHWWAGLGAEDDLITSHPYLVL
jgi:hypothetical protein